MLKQGQRVYVPCNCAEEFSDCAEALVCTDILSVDGNMVTVNNKRGGETKQIPSENIHVNPSVLILCLGDIRSEPTNLDPLSKSILHYCRLLHKEEGNVKLYKTRSLAGLKDLWEEFGELSKVIIFISHGCEDGFTFGRSHKCSTAEELIEIFNQDESKEKKLFISLSCQTGSKDFGVKLSNSSFCHEFIGPEHNVHSALASQFCQTFLANYFMNGSNVIDSFKTAKDAIPGTISFNLFIKGNQYVSYLHPIQTEDNFCEAFCTSCGCFGEFDETNPENGTVVQCTRCHQFYCYSCLNGQSICQTCIVNT